MPPLPKEIQTTRDKVWALWSEVRDESTTLPESELQERRHRADEVRNNPKYDASYRMAANMVHDAAALELERRGR